MAPNSDSTEAIVLNLVNKQNRPLSAQNVADALQNINLEKAAVQKALDTLADSGKISFKEYGNQKIYIARKNQFKIPNTELQQQLGEVEKALSEVERAIKALESKLTLEQIHEKEPRLTMEWLMYLQKELGIEYDGGMGVSLQSFGGLLQQDKKRKRGQ
ncbi:homologous-pairing protein 2 homolog [Ziziphus jujuba]|uniref:Homologous-pairing protein 2 homolog n=1 Tax=Ziziphus jujuba TaxID=326968 RepID=A0ABM3ZXG0_ZIZJJ|nr:homologous-pairing protein 2 homolog [Ziziphus jujuba]